MKNSTLEGRAWACALIAALGLTATLAARASPMTYTASVVTDIQLGKHLYHDAAVTVTFEGDTKDIAQATDSHGNPIQSTYCTSPSATGWFYFLAKGNASVSVESEDDTVLAHLSPNQIFVALDECNGGIGFGSFVGPNGLEPAYPLAFVLGTAASFATSGGSPLSSPANMSGFAWSCIGYPPNGAGALNGNGFCTPPDSYPLQSDQGQIFFYMPYTDIANNGSICCNHYGTLNFGTFQIRQAKDND